MSSFRTHLRQTAQSGRGRRMGFGAAVATAPSPKLLVIAIVEDASAVPALIEAGAGALISTSLDSLEAIVAAAGGVPVGVRVDATTVSTVEQAQEAGVDFIAFDDAQTEAAALLEPEPGRVLLIESDADEELLRTFSGMRLDAIIVAPPAQPLMVRDQLALRRIAELAGAPLIAPSGEAPTTATLHAWRNAGVLAVLVPGDSDLVKATVAAASEVPEPKPVRDDDRGIALVPAVSDGGHVEDDDDEF
jgi:hypothetical protein